MINYSETKTILPALTIILIMLLLVLLRILQYFLVTNPVQNDIFISSCQNCVSIALTCKHYHEIYAMFLGLKNNKNILIYDDVLGL